MLPSIKKEFVVEASQEVAFNVFTQKIDSWWPRTHHIGKTPMTEQVLEPGEGGRWYSRHEDGSEANVGKVLKWNPYEQLMLAWQINGDFEFNPELITEVEINFIPEGPKTTRVKFEHRDLDLLRGGSKVIDDMDNGWGYILNLYKERAEL
jgi:uncharacterized protein YndB with AHSA1/START domain